MTAMRRYAMLPGSCATPGSAPWQTTPKALAVVVLEVRRLLADGQELRDVIEALCELLIHP
jgi:hypothetical protein